jgi:molybdopterin-containing oxidoreductase family molybdopterin binding subunit
MKDYGQVFDVEKNRLPWFDVPIEAWTETIDKFEKNPLADKYPLVYWTGPRRYRTHSHFNWAPNLRELDVEPSVYVSPKDAADRGIADGDYVRIFNDRGQCVACAIFHNGLRPGIVDMDRGWQFGQYTVDDSHHNNLTHMAMEPACLNNSYYDVLCQMEKI